MAIESFELRDGAGIMEVNQSNYSESRSRKKKTKTKLKVEGEKNSALISSVLPLESSLGVDCTSSLPDNSVSIECDIHNKKKNRKKDKSEYPTETEKADQRLKSSVEINDELTKTKGKKKLKLRAVVCDNDSKSISPFTSETALTTQMSRINGEIVGGQIVESYLVIESASYQPDNCVYINRDIHDVKRRKKNKKKNKSKILTVTEKTDDCMENSLEINSPIKRDMKKWKSYPLTGVIDSKAAAPPISETAPSTQEIPILHSEMVNGQDIVEDDQNRDNETISFKTKMKSDTEVDEEGDSALISNKLHLESSCDVVGSSNFPDSLSLECDIHEGKRKKKNKKKNKSEAPTKTEQTGEHISNSLRENDKELTKKKHKKSELHLVNSGKLDLAEVNLNLLSSDVLSSFSLKIESHSIDVEDFAESANQLSQSAISTRNNFEENIVSEGDLQFQNSGNRIFEESKEAELENTSILHGNSFTTVLDCEPVLGRASVESRVVENELENYVKCEIKKFKCEVCQRSYSRRDNLAVHMRTHSDERKFKCSHCDRSFHYRHVLKEHLRLVHSLVQLGQDISFDCNYCPYKAKRKQDLQKHVNGVHLKGIGQLYPCHLCPSTFTYSSNLKKHIDSIHASDEELHVCHLCGKLFRLAQNLKSHSRIHNKKAFNCQVCDQEFPSLHRLRIHLGTHAPRVGFNCPFCEYVLVSKTDERLKRHIREKHSNNFTRQVLG